MLMSNAGRGRRISVLVALVMMVPFMLSESSYSQRNRDQKKQRGRRSDANALKVGQQAPQFTLKSLDGKSETRLKDYQDKKPIVLIFGSYT